MSVTRIWMLCNPVRVERDGRRDVLKPDKARMVVALVLAGPEGLPVAAIADMLGVDVASSALKKRRQRLADETGLRISTALRGRETIYRLAFEDLSVDALEFLKLVDGLDARPETLDRNALEQATALWTAGPPEMGSGPPAVVQRALDRLFDARTALSRLGKRILIVDDRVGDRLAALLSLQHFCDVAHSLEEFNSFKSVLPEFDLAVVDLHLSASYGDQQGDTIVRYINRAVLDLPVVMMSVKPPDNKDYIRWTDQLGLAAFIKKEPQFRAMRFIPREDVQHDNRDIHDRRLSLHPGGVPIFGGVAAEPGFEIVRVRFRRPIPLAEGFAHIEHAIRDAGRPLTAFCACELRSPAPFTEDGFRAFNEIYAGTLDRWGIFDRRHQSGRALQCLPRGQPAARAVVSRLLLHGRGRRRGPSFVVAGSGEARKARATIATTRCAAATPARAGLEARRASCSAKWNAGWEPLGFGWADTTAAQIYTVHDFHPFLADEIVRRGAARRPHLALRPAAGARCSNTRWIAARSRRSGSLKPHGEERPKAASRTMARARGHPSRLALLAPQDEGPSWRSPCGSPSTRGPASPACRCGRCRAG